MLVDAIFVLYRFFLLLLFNSESKIWRCWDTDTDESRTFVVQAQAVLVEHRGITLTTARKGPTLYGSLYP